MLIVCKYFKRIFNFRTFAVVFITSIVVYFLTCHYNSNDNTSVLEAEKITEPTIKTLPDKTVHLVVLFSKANAALEKKFLRFIRTLFLHASVPVVLHIVGDPKSHEIARKYIKTYGEKHNYKINMYNLLILAEQVKEELKVMQKYFSYRDGSYYSDILFFISTVLHIVLYEEKVLMIDIDVQFLDDINKLYQQFEKFSPTAIIGIAYEQQPVYRHVFQLYRQVAVNTSIGNPPPNGFPGFNSGVLLLDLEGMRKSDVYNHILKGNALKQLSEMYKFKGHLGDQDFFTLISLSDKFRNLFYVLPCGWNRQLCEWWRHHGYENIFDEFHACNEVVSLYHGNCNTPLDDV